MTSKKQEQQKEQIMKSIHILFVLGLTSVLTACFAPHFNEDGLKSFLKDKAEITIEDSLSITHFEWGAAIGDYYEEYDLKCSPSDHKRMLNHAIQNGWENWERGYSLVIPPISFSDTAFIFSVHKDKQEIGISIIEE